MINPFSVKGSWRIDPDNKQDRGSSKVVKRSMTPEEIKEYGKVGEPYKNKAQATYMAGKDINMGTNKIDEKRLIEIVKEHGFTKKAYGIAADEFGLKNTHSIECYISNNKLRDKIAGLNDDKPIIQDNANIEEQNPLLKMDTDELSEILNKVKLIVQENKRMKALSDENETLKGIFRELKTLLEGVECI